MLSLDPSGNVVLNVATGTTDQFDTTGVEYVYSITEKVAPGHHAEAPRERQLVAAAGDHRQSRPASACRDR